MRTFTCDRCGEEFETDQTIGEAIAEARAAFTPDELGEGSPSVCDGCWHELRAMFPELDARYAQ